MTTGGTYNFIFQSTDSASNVIDSLPASITVNAMFSQPTPVLYIVSNVINDLDSGNFGPWALDTLTRTASVEQTGLTSFTANFIDTGISTTYAGAFSPVNGFIEPATASVQVSGSQDIAFNGTFSYNSLSSLELPTNMLDGENVGTIDDQGTVQDLYSQTYGTTPYTTPYTYAYLIYTYFNVPGTTTFNDIMNGAEGNYTTLDWGYTYTYNSPSGTQTLINGCTGISSSTCYSNNQDIIAYVQNTANVPVTLPANTMESFNYANSNAVITVTSANAVTATIYIANVTNNSTLSYTSTNPSATLTSFTKISILNLSVSSNSATNFTVGVTIAIPCGSNAAPYEFNSTTGSWTLLSITNSTSCSITFNVPADPVIGIFTSAAIAPPPPPPSVGTGVGPQPLPVPSPSPTPTITTPTPTVAPTTPTSPPPPQAPSTVVPSPVATPAPTPAPTTPTTTVVAPAPTTPTSSITPTVIALIAGIAIAIAAAGAYYGLGRRAAAQRKK